MKLKLFKRNTKFADWDNDLPRACRFCERATIISDEENVLCSLKGIVYADYCCRKFAYDPLKREPKMPPPMPKPDLSALGLELPLFSAPKIEAEPAAQGLNPEAGEPLSQNSLMIGSESPQPDNATSPQAAPGTESTRAEGQSTVQV